MFGNLTVMSGPFCTYTPPKGVHPELLLDLHVGDIQVHVAVGHTSGIHWRQLRARGTGNRKQQRERHQHSLHQGLRPHTIPERRVKGSAALGYTPVNSTHVVA